MKKFWFILFCLFCFSNANAQELKLNDIKKPLSQKSYIFNFYGTKRGISTYQAIKTINTIVLKSDVQNKLTEINFTFFHNAHRKDLTPVLRDLQTVFLSIAADKKIAQSWLNECLQHKQAEIKMKDDRFFYQCRISEDVSEFTALQR